MKKSKKYWQFVLILIAVFTIFTFYRLREMGAFNSVKTQFSGSYKVAARLPGPEDFQLDRTTGILYISSDDRWATESGNPVRGGIYSLDANLPTANPRLLTRTDPVDFHPHGLSLFRGKDGRKVLFVVNHRESGVQTVEIFDMPPDGSLVLRQTVKNKLLIWPNDIVGVGFRKFYVTNVSRYGKGLGRMLDTFFNLKGGFIAYFDGEEMKIVAKNLAFPNGIQIGRNARNIYLAETLSGYLKVFSRNIEDGTLSLSKSYFIGGGLDNITLDSQGALWIAIHPNLMAVTFHLNNPRHISPSKIVKIIPRRAGFELEEEFLDSGKLQSAASVAAPFKDKLFVGAFCESKILELKRQRN